MIKRKNSELVEQIQKVHDDQVTELEYVRESRKLALERIADLDAREIELLLGIEKTTEILSSFGVGKK